MINKRPVRLILILILLLAGAWLLTGLRGCRTLHDQIPVAGTLTALPGPPSGPASQESTQLAPQKSTEPAIAPFQSFAHPTEGLPLAQSGEKKSPANLSRPSGERTRPQPISTKAGETETVPPISQTAPPGAGNSSSAVSMTGIDISSTTKKKRYRGGLAEERDWWGYRCGINAESNIVIKEDDDWDKFRAQFIFPPDWQPEKEAHDPRLRIPPPILPDIDFEKMMVIGVFTGRVQQGYRIFISSYSVDEDGDSMSVEYAKTMPLPNPMKGTTLTEPYHIKVIRRFEGKVSFWQRP